jgi:hypothetical protein
MNVNDALVAIVRATPVERRTRAAILAIVLIRLPVVVASGVMIVTLWK